MSQFHCSEPIQLAVVTAPPGQQYDCHLQDVERRRLARDLHDGPAQIMTGIALLVSDLAETESSAPRKEKLTQAIRLAEQCARELRSIAYGLHPPMLEELGLEGAIRTFVEEFQGRTGIAVGLKIQRGSRRFSSELELAVFRIVQEALSNVHRHSGSPTVAVQLEYDDCELRLSVRDSGRGFVANLQNGARGLGLRSMRDRAGYFGGNFQVHSSSGGTTIGVNFPLEG